MQTPPKEYVLPFVSTSRYENFELDQTLNECMQYPEIFSKVLSDKWGF